MIPILGKNDMKFARSVSRYTEATRNINTLMSSLANRVDTLIIQTFGWSPAGLRIHGKNIIVLGRDGKHATGQFEDEAARGNRPPRIYAHRENSILN